MKKKNKIILLLVVLMFLVGCNNKVDNFMKDVKKDVTSSIKNTSKGQISKSVKYIHDHYEKKIDKDFVYHTLLLKKLCDNSYMKESKMKRLAEAAYEYMFRQSKGNKKELEDSLSVVYDNLDEEVNEFYLLYKRLAVVEGYLAKAKTKLLVEEEEKDFISVNKINQAINYIRDYYDNAIKNNETIERLGYYSMYLERIGAKSKKENDIVKLGKNMKKYLQDGDEKKLEEINDILKKIEESKEIFIGELITE